MAAGFYSKWLLKFTVFFVCGCLICCADTAEPESDTVDSENEGDDAKKDFNQGTVLFNNPKLLPQNTKDGQDGMFDFDRSQETFNPNIMGGVNIQREALTLGDRLRDLSNTEMGVLSMQVTLISCDGMYTGRQPDTSGFIWSVLSVEEPTHFYTSA